MDERERCTFWKINFLLTWLRHYCKTFEILVGEVKELPFLKIGVLIKNSDSWAPLLRDSNLGSLREGPGICTVKKYTGWF